SYDDYIDGIRRPAEMLARPCSRAGRVGPERRIGLLVPAAFRLHRRALVRGLGRGQSGCGDDGGWKFRPFLAAARSPARGAELPKAMVSIGRIGQGRYQRAGGLQGSIAVGPEDIGHCRTDARRLAALRWPLRRFLVLVCAQILSVL